MSTEKGKPPYAFHELSSHYGQPKSEILPKILERLVTPGEAKILLSLPATLEQIAESAGISVARASEALESLFRRGLVLPQSSEDGKRGFALCGNLIDSTLFGIGFKKKQGAVLSAAELEAIDLWDEYFEDLMRKKLPTDNISIARVIPVNRAISVETAVLPFEVISGIIRNARSIAVAQCPCRTRGRKCANPLETCILLDSVAEILIKRQVARKLTTEEALDILERCEDLGLVHHADNASEGITFICNCCSCCCFFLRGLIHYGKRNSVKSRYKAVVREDLCTGCGICEARCVFEAMKVENEVAYSNPEICFGCGLCATKCPSQAISLVPVAEKDHIPERKAQDLIPALPPHKVLLESLKRLGSDV